MKQLLLFAIIGTGIVGMTMGFASNTIDLTVQQLGVGEEFIGTPITHANVDFELAKVEVTQDTTTEFDDFFVNLITACSFSTEERIPGPATIICKLTDGSGISPDGDPSNDFFGLVIAEGNLFLPNGYDPAVDGTILIPITQTAFPNANDVQNIHDVKIIVKGASPTGPPQGPP